jgi:hypothetical protein
MRTEVLKASRSSEQCVTPLLRSCLPLARSAGCLAFDTRLGFALSRCLAGYTRLAPRQINNTANSPKPRRAKGPVLETNHHDVDQNTWAQRVVLRASSQACLDAVRHILKPLSNTHRRISACRSKNNIGVSKNVHGYNSNVNRVHRSSSSSSSSISSSYDNTNSSDSNCDITANSEINNAADTSDASDNINASANNNDDTVNVARNMCSGGARTQSRTRVYLTDDGINFLV